MANNTAFTTYDFKRLGPKRSKDENNNVNYFYRGMPFGSKKDGTKVYASARDIGNYSAGYMAGKEGFSWFESPWALMRSKVFKKEVFLLKAPLRS